MNNSESQASLSPLSVPAQEEPNGRIMPTRGPAAEEAKEWEIVMSKASKKHSKKQYRDAVVISQAEIVPLSDTTHAPATKNPELDMIKQLETMPIAEFTSDLHEAIITEVYSSDDEAHADKPTEEEPSETSEDESREAFSSVTSKKITIVQNGRAIEAELEARPATPVVVQFADPWIGEPPSTPENGAPNHSAPGILQTETRRAPAVPVLPLQTSQKTDDAKRVASTSSDVEIVAGGQFTEQGDEILVAAATKRGTVVDKPVWSTYKECVPPNGGLRWSDNDFPEL